MKPQPPITIPPCGHSGHTPLNNSQDNNETVSFRQVLYHWCCIGSEGNITSPSPSPTLFHIWFAQNVHPLVTPKRIFCFTLSQICFFLAYGFFCQTKLYKSYIHGCEDHDHDHQARPLIFLAAAFGVHTLCLIFLFFFSFCSVALKKYRYHYLIKSIGEYVVKILVVLLIMRIGDDHQVEPLHATSAPSPTQVNDTAKLEYSEVAGLVTWCLLTIDALCIMGLLNPGHHYSLFEAIVTLTLHLGLARGNYCRIPAAVFVLVIVVIKNFLWKHFDHPQVPTNNEHRSVAWVAPV